jgi:hypothetical protein
MQEILKQAIEHYGVQHQLGKAQEELFELGVEVYRRKKHQGSNEALAMEIADVEIMCEQLKIIGGLHEAVKDYKKAKLERLKEGMGAV